MVQPRVARFIFNDYSYNTSVTSLLKTLNWPTLQNRRRINLRAMMLYKIINNLIQSQQTHFFRITPPPHVIRFWTTNKILHLEPFHKKVHNVAVNPFVSKLSLMVVKLALLHLFYIKGFICWKNISISNTCALKGFLRCHYPNSCDIT